MTTQTTTISKSYIEVRSNQDVFGFLGTFETTEEAINYINASSQKNTDEYVLVFVESTKVFIDDIFHHEETNRTRVARIKLNEADNSYVRIE